jgi:hypothetical protein
VLDRQPSSRPNLAQINHEIEIGRSNAEERGKTEEKVHIGRNNQAESLPHPLGTKKYPYQNPL